MKTLNRREFLALTAGGAAATAMSLAGCQNELAAEAGTSAKYPNILWISTEDISCDLGCYGARCAVTPNIDALASRSIRYTNAYSHSGVCAPARSGIITGMYPTTIGAHHMRCKAVPPACTKCFTECLRAAGYYCTNNSKTDYQFDSPVTAWDENSPEAHWRGRGKSQPFFSVINLTVTHESRIRDHSEGFHKQLTVLKPHEKHDPAKALLPPYYPDTPEVRRDWTQYYDIITLMDRQFGRILRQLEDDGLSDDTIVWFWSDHGRGLPRAKRWIYDSGIKVPLIIGVPEKFRKLADPENPDAIVPGSVNEELVAFLDFAPTMLSLVGVKIPEYMQGRAFLGPQKTGPPKYIFAARDRMDETYDIIRAARDRRFKYIRNFMPHLTYAQNIKYMDLMPTMSQMRRLNAEGSLKGPQKLYFRRTKPVEELYDTLADPHEINNLADGPAYDSVLKRMRRALHKWMKDTGDVGLIPEPEFDQMRRPGGKWQKTSEPVFHVISKSSLDRQGRVAIVCNTPGASIAYRIGSQERAAWKLYTKPVPLRPGRLLTAKACRLGYHDSRPVKFQPGDKTDAAAQMHAGSDRLLHWRNRIDKTDMLERLRKIKSLDYLGEPAAGSYMKALSDRYASVRYWAVLGLHNNCKAVRQIEHVKPAVGELLSDSSPIVRIAAAEAMCIWGEQRKALPVLVAALKHECETVRLNAVIALGRIADKASAAAEDIKALKDDKNRYVQRVARSLLLRLRNRQ